MIPSISAAIITKNESSNIRRCLESLRWVDDIVVVDCGSVDDTVDICREFNCRVFHREWDGFAGQKNYSLAKSDADWVLSIDADEAVTPELADEIRAVISGSDKSAYEIPRQNIFLGKPMRHGGWYPDRQLRLLRNGIGEFTHVPLHEHIHFPQGQVRVGRLANPFLHYTDLSLKDFLAKADRYTDIELDAAIKEGHAPKSLILSMVTAIPAKFGEVYLYKGGWKDGLHGFIGAVLMSVRVFIRYAKMWEALQQKQMESEERKARI